MELICKEIGQGGVGVNGAALNGMVGTRTKRGVNASDGFNASGLNHMGFHHMTSKLNLTQGWL